MTSRLMTAARRRPHVFVVSVPGGTAVRLAVECELRRRAWPVALSPADTDLLVTAGVVPAAMEAALLELWDETPSPRARAAISDAATVPASLNAAQRDLEATDLGAERPDHNDQPGTESAGEDVPEESTRSDRDSDHPMDDVPGISMPVKAPHQMDDMPGMSMPAGLAMAERGPDRDGLQLDQLHIALGPGLSDWPSGLILRITLQGDVIQEARAEAVEAKFGLSFWTEPWFDAEHGATVTVGEAARRTAASHLDSLGRLLAVAGWVDAAAAARGVRDDVLAGSSPSALDLRFTRLSRRVGRSRVLAWLTAGLGVLPAERATALGVTGPTLRAAGDVSSRYRRWLTECSAALDQLGDVGPLPMQAIEGPRGRLDGAAAPSAGLLTAIEALVVGVEIGAARLIVASLDPDLDEVSQRPPGRPHG